jgi:hypothetical protein
MPDLELKDDPMTYDQAVEQLYYWGAERMEDRDRAFDTLLGWVAGRAITGDPDAASTLRLIRDRAERS